MRVDGRLVREGGDGTVVAVLDGWLRLRIPSEAAPLVLQLRARVDELFVGIVERPGSRGDPDSLSALIGAVVALFDNPNPNPSPNTNPNPNPNPNPSPSPSPNPNPNLVARSATRAAWLAVMSPSSCDSQAKSRGLFLFGSRARRSASAAP